MTSFFPLLSPLPTNSYCYALYRKKQLAHFFFLNFYFNYPCTWLVFPKLYFGYLPLSKYCKYTYLNLKHPCEFYYTLKDRRPSWKFRKQNNPSHNIPKTEPTNQVFKRPTTNIYFFFSNPTLNFYSIQVDPKDYSFSG